MNIPEELKYTEEHEWVKIEDNIATIGIDSIIRSLISLKINFLCTFHLLGLKNDIFIIKKYLPISSMYNMNKLYT